jgi:hypothetical protein
VDLTCEYLEKLPAERSGKFRHIVSELPIGQIRQETTKQGASARLG